MKRTLLLVALLAAASFTFGQTKSEEKPLRKIASGNGARQIEEDVREAMKEVRIELDNINIEIDNEIDEAMREMRRELRDIDFDHDIDIDIDNDFDFDHDIDIDVDHDFDFDFDEDFDIDIDVEAIVESALRGAQISVKQIDQIVNTAVKESTREVKKVRVREP
jgi:hypothetical protein